MVLAEVPERIIDIGTWAGVIVAVIGAARTAPGRWLWRRLAERPVGEWLDKKHAQAIAPVLDRLDVQDVKITAQGAELTAQGVRLTSHLVKEEGDVSRIDGLLKAGDQRMGRLEEGQDEIKSSVAEMRGELTGALAAFAGHDPHTEAQTPLEVRPSLRPPGPKNVWGGQ